MAETAATTVCPSTSDGANTAKKKKAQNKVADSKEEKT